jgi:hypothetical protein
MRDIATARVAHLSLKGERGISWLHKYRRKWRRTKPLNVLDCTPWGEKGAALSADESAHETRSTRTIALARLVIGALQGAALYFLYYARETHTWPATDGLTFAPLLFIALFVPLGISLSLGSLRATTLTIWAAAAALALANVAHYAMWKLAPEWVTLETFNAGEKFALQTQIVPSFGVFFFTAVWLFIAHVLIVGSDNDRRIVAVYHTHFDIGWKLAVRLVLGAAFVGMFWAVLWLGADLFELIKLDFLKKLIEHEWFSIPATALTVAVAAHLTDVRVNLVRGMRTLALVLLGWFLPLLTVMVVGFLAALMFTGLEPLWQTRHASVSLLAAAGALVILINATYQEGGGEAPRVLRYAGSLAAIALVPLAALAAYALKLRVGEYGWTADRVATEACVVVAACYAIGYAFAAIYPGPWLKQIERWNFVTAILILIVLAAIFSPLADPDRIAVASQVARLEGGKIAPDKFDFDYLRWQGGVYGVSALETLASSAQGKSANYIRAKAAALLAKKTRYQSPPKAQASDVVANVRVYPNGEKLPDDFVRQDWNKTAYANYLPACLTWAGNPCEAFLLDLEQSGTFDIVILDRFGSATGAVFARDVSGVWRVTGRPGPLWACASVISALEAGEVAISAPAMPHWHDITVRGAHLTLLPPDDNTASCPK